MSDLPDHIAEEISLLINGGNDYFEVKGNEYLLRFMEQTDFRSPVAYNICYALEQYGPEIEGFPLQENAGKGKKKETTKKDVYAYNKNPPRGKVKKEDWDTVMSHLKERIEILTADGQPERPTPLKNLMKLSEYLGASEIEKNALEYIYCAEGHDYLGTLTSIVLKKDEAIGPVVATMCGDQKNYRAYGKALAPQSKFVSYGVMERVGGAFMPGISAQVVDNLSQPDLTKSEIVEKFVGVPCETDLDYEDFAYMGEELEMICDIIENAVKNGDKGVNILVYGPAGGGKTELTRAISKKLNIPLYSIGEEQDNSSTTREVPQFDEDGDFIGSMDVKSENNGTTGQKRMADLLRAQSLLKGGNSSFLLFDEIEDLLLKGTDTEKAADTESKIAVNRMLENNPVPVIWNGNDPQKFHEAVRDRFAFSFYVDRPPVSVRRKIWQKQADLQGVELPAKDLDHLAREYDASPRKITLALKSAKVSGRGKAAIEMALPASAKITHGSSSSIKDYSSTSRFYNPEFSNIKPKTNEGFSLPGLIERGNNKNAFALLATGSTGTGLRSLSRHIAEGMDVNIAEFSMGYLAAPEQMGPSPEQKIAGAFNSAADTRRILAIHDMEVIAGTPSNPNSWDPDLTEVLLSAAREHKLPFILTSGAADVQFPAKLQAVFSDQVSLNTMDVAQRHAAFETFFGQKAPNMIDKLDGIVIADFANVRKDILKKDTSKVYGDDIVRLLAKQVEIRMTKSENGIGFGAGQKSKTIDLPPKPEGPVMTIYPAVSETMPS